MPCMLQLSRTLALAVLALVTLVSAAPSTPSLDDILRRGGDKDHSPNQYPTNCDLSDSKGVPTIPPNITIVDDEKPKYVFLARGTQNYTCETNPATNTFQWTSIGAVADFYDASCLISLPGSSYFPIAALAFIPYPADPSKFNWPIAAKHFFRVRGRPVFKLTSGDEPEFVGIRTGGADSPDDPAVDVQWLQLGKVSGDLPGVNTFYRVNTAGGQPQTLTCDPATDVATLTVDYSAYYWAYGP